MLKLKFKIFNYNSLKNFNQTTDTKLETKVNNNVNCYKNVYMSLLIWFKI